MSALDSRHNILAVLESWCSLVADELGHAAPTRSVPDLARFLLRNVEWLTEQPPAADFADEIDGLRRELLRTIDPERGELRAPVWECVMTDCTGKISAPSQSVGTAGATKIRCSSGHAWEMHEWITLRPLVERRRKAVGT
ncbi:hypothetical protein ABZ820_18345 [Streptomyces diacarni]|nr:hypothetical protein [Streptomyces diacarni]